MGRNELCAHTCKINEMLTWVTPWVALTYVSTKRSRAYFAEVEISMLKVICNQWVSNKTILAEEIICPDPKTYDNKVFTTLWGW